MENMISVDLPVLPPHEKSPSFVKGVGGMSVKPDQIDTLIEILETLRDEKYPKIPFQILEGNMGNYVSCNIFKKTQVEKEKSDNFDWGTKENKPMSNEVTSNQDISIEVIPF